MRRGTVEAMAIFGALMLLTFTAGGSFAATALASGGLDMADMEEDNVIPAGWPSYSEAKQCIFKGSCPELEGKAYADVDISTEMQAYQDGAVFYVSNAILSPTTLWFVCSYNEDGRALDCWYDQERSWGLRGELSSDARELRLMPVQSAPNEYHLDLYVY